MSEPDAGQAVQLDHPGLDQLIKTLHGDGYRVIGPALGASAIELGELRSAADLPAGWGADAEPGRYRLGRRSDHALFAHSAGPQSWKQFLHPPRRQLWSAGGDGEFRAADPAPGRLAFLGVRGCDLAGIRALRGVLGGGAHPDASFTRAAGDLFVVAVHCTEPGGVCFCASMGTGPAAGPGYDIALTELAGREPPRLLAEAGSEAGAALLARVASHPAGEDAVAAARAQVAAAAQRMGRAMPEVDLWALMRDSRDSPVWDDVANRCLTCGNCTMVCPTCFCTTAEDSTDLSGGNAGRWQRWASCFELDFSYIHGGPVRPSGQSRYRQWISHKLGTWHDQFGGSGCVGCGRCIAWCPAGIDITAEAARLAGQDPGTTGEERA